LGLGEYIGDACVYTYTIAIVYMFTELHDSVHKYGNSSKIYF